MLDQLSRNGALFQKPKKKRKTEHCKIRGKVSKLSFLQVDKKQYGIFVTSFSNAGLFVQMLQWHEKKKFFLYFLHNNNQTRIHTM